MSLYKLLYPSPIGPLYLVADAYHLLEVKMQPSDNYSAAESASVLPLNLAKEWLEGYFRGQAPDLSSVPLLPSGTDFQRHVWTKLMNIPYGQTATYGQIAAQISTERGIRKMSAQAVGQAIGANPINILIPCHRVVGSGGKLTGYAGGVDKKASLLAHETASHCKIG